MSKKRSKKMRGITERKGWQVCIGTKVVPGTRHIVWPTKKDALFYLRALKGVAKGIKGHRSRVAMLRKLNIRRMK